MKISVTTKKDGFRRAGRAWTGTTILEQDDLNEEQWSQLDNDPMFDVQEVQNTDIAGANIGELVELDESEPELIAKKENDTIITAMVEAIGKLDATNKDHYDRAKKPKVKALIAATGVKNINAKMRDEAFALFNANNDSE